MTTFAKHSFDAANYLRYRPTYPSSLISHVLKYAVPEKNAVALDLGCGPGQATALLASSGRFRQVTGMDPSQGMIAAAQSALENDIGPLLGDGNSQDAVEHVEKCQVQYIQGAAEDLSSVQPGSVDLITAGQAAHWFDHEKAYAELARILKPGGTVAYFGYAYMFIPEAPEASQRILELGTKKLAAFWEPGRDGPESLYDLVPFPKESGWNSATFQRCKFDQTESKAYTPSNDASPPPETSHHPVTMSKRMTREDLMNSLKTWSSVHNYMEKHPSSRNVIDLFHEEVKGILPSQEPFTVQWPIGMLLMKKNE